MSLYKIRRLLFIGTNDELLLRRINIHQNASSIVLRNGKSHTLDKSMKPNPDANYLKLYKHHDVWLNKVIHELDEGKRVAFGAFHNYTDHTHELPFPQEIPEECLLGSIILKKGHAGQIELKNFLTNHYDIRKCFPAEDIKKNKGKIRQSLIDRVENFCSFRNYRRLEIEVSSLNYDIINFLLNNHYSILHTRRSKYKDSDYFYIFQKHLSNFQGSDPYDDIKLVENILTHYFPFQKTQDTKTQNSHDINFKTINYILSSKSDRDTANDSSLGIEKQGTQSEREIQDFKKQLGKDLDISIECKIDFDHHRLNEKDNYLTIDDSVLQTYDPSTHVKILFTDKQIVYANRKGTENSLVDSIKVLSWGQFAELDDIKKLHLDKLIKKENIKGFLLVVDGNAKKKILKQVNSNTEHLLHLFDGCGGSLQNDDNFGLHNQLKIFFFSHSDDTQKSDGIWGYADVKRVGGGRLDFLPSEHSIQNIYGENEYSYFSYYNDEQDKNVVIVTINDIQSIDQPVRLRDVLSPTIQSYITSKEGNKRDSGYWFDTFWFNSYLDSITVDAIMKQKDKEINHQPSLNNPKESNDKEVNSPTQIKRNPIKKLKTAVILTAIPEEYDAVRAHLKKIEAVRKKETRYEQGVFEYDGVEIAKVIIRECGQTNPVAALETERAISMFNPKILLFVGIAGSRKKQDFDIGDVIIPHIIYGYEAGKADKNLFGARPRFGGTDFIINEAAKFSRIKEEWKNLIKDGDGRNYKAGPGIIASGEKLIEHYDSHTGKILTRYYNDTQAVETEGFGFGSAILRHEDVKIAGSVRGISDILKTSDFKKIQNKNTQKEANEDRRPTGNKKLAATNAAAFAYWLIMDLFASH